MFVILGATGKVGGATIRSLLEHGAPVRAIVRERAQAEQFVALGCEAAVADLADAAAVERAIAGATAVQVICPTFPQAADALGAMAAVTAALASAMRARPPAAVLAISDYGAELGSGTGITLAFNRLESELAELPAQVTFLRSAEQMQNWSRFVAGAAETGVLTSLHQPLGKSFPSVSAPDVGLAAAALLLQPGTFSSPRVVHVEGPRRSTALDVATMLSGLLEREIVARELPHERWLPALMGAGIGASYAELVVSLFDAHNAGRIDAERSAGEVLLGATDLHDVLASLVR